LNHCENTYLPLGNVCFYMTTRHANCPSASQRLTPPLLSYIFLLDVFPPIFFGAQVCRTLTHGKLCDLARERGPSNTPQNSLKMPQGHHQHHPNNVSPEEQFNLEQKSGCKLVHTSKNGCRNPRCSSVAIDISMTQIGCLRSCEWPHLSLLHHGAFYLGCWIPCLNSVSP
jgi:hypothetical protein